MFCWSQNFRIVLVILLAVVVLSASPVAAQVLVNGEPNPAFNSNAMQLWYRADAGVTTSGGAVSQWDDQSTHGRHATQTNAANQPTHTASGLGGRPAVNFDDTDDFLDTGLNLTDTGSGSFTLFTVIAPDPGRAEQNMVFGNFDSGSPRLFTNIDGAALSWLYQGDGGFSATNAANPFPDSPTSYEVITWELNDAADTQTLYVGTTQLQQRTKTIDHSTFSIGGTAFLGAAADMRTADPDDIFFPFGGGISEVILYKGVLDPDDLLAVQNYLPEPSSLLLLVICGVGLLVHRRRR